tara:strand:+ start:1267 stop:2253 length:987 start_codon:yes stop_codon:yes gene_type:complete
MEKIKDIKYLNDLLSLLKKHYVKSSFKFKSSNKSFSVDSQFISSNIMNNIHNYNKVYECNLPNIDCIIFTKHLTNKVKLDIQLMINRFNTMINFFKYNNISFNTDKFTFIYVSTDYKKVFPDKNNILGPNEINSGMSYFYENKIYIWREEECLKVFLHELFHCLGFDRFLINSKCNLKSFFNVSNHLSCNEGYNELCALIYHCCFLTIENKKLNLIELIEKNRLFTLYQIKQILQHQNFQTLNRYKKFKQNTSVFSYFILKGFYLFYINELIELIKIDTIYFFPINNFKRFELYKNTCLNNNNFYEIINRVISKFKYNKNKTLCMSVY